jgi:hypothetical protein
MPRSTLYVTLLKKIINAANRKDPTHFYQAVEEVENHLHELSEEEQFDLKLNLQVEKKNFEESL